MSARPRLRPPFRLRRGPLMYAVVGLILLDCLVYSTSDTWERYSPDDYAERVNACRSAPRDLIVVGGSPVSEGIDPSPMREVSWRGKRLDSVYAMGLPGGTTSESWHAVKHGSLVPPRLLIYGTTASDLNDARNEHHGPRSLMDWSDWWSWASSREDSAEWVTRHFLLSRLGGTWQLFRHRDGIKLWAAHQAHESLGLAFPDALARAEKNLEYTRAMREGNGYAPNPDFVNARYDQRKAAGLVQTSFHFLEKYRLGDHLSYLQRMLDWAEANGTDVVLVDMPVAEELESEMYAEEFVQYRAALRKLSEERGVRILWANREALGIDDRHFSDLIHLNGEGAARLSAWIAEELRRMPEGR